MALAVVLLGYNVTKINWDAPLGGESTVALIGVLACICAVLLLVILLISKKIARKSKG